MDELIYFGGEVKALGEGKVGGHLIRFTSANQPDLTGDYFDVKTVIHAPDTLPVFYQHGFDKQLGKRILGNAKTGMDEIGWWIEAQLNMRDEYEKAVYAMAEKGKLGWSSGALSHLVERENEGKASHIKSWFIGEASLTPTPAEPLNAVVPLKSLLTSDESLNEPEGTPNVKKKSGEPIMDEKEIQALVEKAVTDAATKAADAVSIKAAEITDQKLEAFKSALPEIKAGYHLEVVEDEADKAARENPFKSVGDFFMAVKNAAMYPSETDKRLLPFKAQGVNEAIPSQGGFLVPQQVADGVFEKMYKVGELLKRVSRDPVSGNNLRINAVSETSRVNGSRYGGVQGYWLEESGSITATKPAFEAIDLKLKKVGALVYGTDEVLEDTAFLSSYLNRVVPEELRFRTEAAIYEGDGVGKPLGWLNSDAVINVTRTNANQVLYADVIAMWARRYAGVSDYVWFVNQDVMPQLDQLIHNGTGSIPPRFVDYDAQGIMRMKGKPVIEVEYAQSLGTAGDIMLISPSQYQLIDKASGVQAASSIHVAFTTAEQAFRFIYRVDGAPLWRSALTPFHGSNTVTPYVALLATS